MISLMYINISINSSFYDSQNTLSQINMLINKNKWITYNKVVWILFIMVGVCLSKIVCIHKSSIRLLKWNPVVKNTDPGKPWWNEHLSNF